MKTENVVTALSALAYEHRLEAYRLLVQAGPEGMPAGIISEKLDIPASTLTFHLQQLLHSGLVSQRRLGRQIIYAADYAVMNKLMAFLTENCCGGQECCPPACNPEKIMSKKNVSTKQAVASRRKR